jgi:xylan 1,4-beta-xylosidase
MATLDSHQLAIMLWNYHDDDTPGPAADIELSLSGLPHGDPVTETQYRIDQEHSNAYVAWHKMGSPANPTREQYAQLQAAGLLAMSQSPHPVKFDGRHFSEHLKLQRRGVALVVLTFN